MPHERRRGRPPGSSNRSPRSLKTADYLAAASMAGLGGNAGMYAAAAAYPKLAMAGLPYGLANMYNNPMYAASLASLGYMTQLPKSGDDEKEPGEITKEDKEQKASSSGSKEDKSPAKSPTAAAANLSAAASNPSLLMYNQMLYAQTLYAQSLAASYTMPAGVSSSLSSLAQAQSLVNGMQTEDDQEQEDSKEKTPDKLTEDKASLPDDTDNQPLNLNTKCSSPKSTVKNVHTEEVKESSVEDISSHNSSSEECIQHKPESPQDLSSKPAAQSEQLS